jgi:hypothetical protein
VVKDKVRKAHQALKETALQPNDPFYVATLNAPPGKRDPVLAMAADIEFQEGGGTCLFTGQRGTGKSTELQRLKQELKQRNMVSLYADMSEYILLTKPIEVSDFLMAVCGALSEKVKEAYPQFPDKEGYWDRAKQFMTSEVDLGELSTSVGQGPGLNIKASLRTDPTFKQQLQERMRGHLAALVKHVQRFVADTVAWVRHEDGDEAKKVVLILDSIERLQGSGPEAKVVFDSVRNLFLADANSLRIPGIHTVFTMPPYLSTMAPGAPAYLGADMVHRHRSVHVFKRPVGEVLAEPARDDEGVAQLVGVVVKRLRNHEEIFSQEALESLCVASGGDIRDLFRMLKSCLTGLVEDSWLPITKAAANQVAQDKLNEMMPIPEDHLGWLKRIATTNAPCMQSENDLPTFAHFLDNRLVLNYRNGEDWYDIHPLLRPIVLKHEPVASPT